MTLEELTKQIQERVGEKSALAAIILFDFGEDGAIRIDGKSDPAVVDNSTGEADCTIKVSLEDFSQIVEGSLNAQMAFMTGKLRVEGDMSIAMQLSQVLG